MPRHRAVVVSAITATVLPVFPVYAADPAPVAQPESTAVSLPYQPTLSQPAAVPAARPESWAVPGLNFDPETVPFRAFSRRDGFAKGTPAGSPLKVTPDNPASRTGWQFSGRVGPVRWLAPLEGEGGTRMRFGGRVPGQPRMPGMGLFNVGVHYTFE